MNKILLIGFLLAVLMLSGCNIMLQVCIDGDTQGCYTGLDGTEGIGECKSGTQNCTNGEWDECVGQVIPVDETCNGLDDDCNGVVDDRRLVAEFISCDVGL